MIKIISGKMIKIINGPVEQGHDKYNSFLKFIQFQLRSANTSGGTEILILLLHLAVQLDLHTVTINRNRSYLQCSQYNV